MEQFNARLKKAMQIKGMKQVDLVGMTGISKSMISEYVKGKFIPKQDNLYLIAKALNVEEAWLMGFEDVKMERSPREEITRSNFDLMDLSEFICVATEKSRAHFAHLYNALLIESESLNEIGMSKAIDFLILLQHDDANTTDLTDL